MRPVLGNHADLNGRASRSEYWWWIGALFGVYIIIAIVTSLPFTLGSILWLVVSLGTILPGLAVAVRRLHDTGRSGWWLLLALIPVLGLVLLLFMILDSEPTANQWGAPPLGSRYYVG